MGFYCVFLGHQKVRASDKFHKDVLEVQLEPNPEEDDSMMVRHRQLVVDTQNEERKKLREKTLKNRSARNDSGDNDRGDLKNRTTLSHEQRTNVHSAIFNNLDPIKDLSSTGLLTFGAIDAIAKKQKDLEDVMNELLLTHKNKSKVKCTIQASVKNKTVKMHKEALSKKKQKEKTDKNNAAAQRRTVADAE
jgi:hypothetical protein